MADLFRTLFEREKRASFYRLLFLATAGFPNREFGKIFLADP